MVQGAARVRWIGLVAILFSLFTPLFNTDVLAEKDVPDPEVVIADEGTLTVPEPTVEPSAEPTIAPTATMIPTGIPAPEPTATVVPTVEPTAEPTTEPADRSSAPDSPSGTPAARTLESTHEERNATAQFRGAFTLDSATVNAGETIHGTIEVTNIGSERAPAFELSLGTSTLPLESMSLESSACSLNTTGGTSTTISCLELGAGSPAVLKVSIPTTDRSCGKHEISVSGPDVVIEAQGVTVTCETDISTLSVDNFGPYDIVINGPESVTLGEDHLWYDITLPDLPYTGWFVIDVNLPKTGGTWEIVSQSFSEGFRCQFEDEFRFVRCTLNIDYRWYPPADFTFSLRVQSETFAEPEYCGTDFHAITMLQQPNFDADEITTAATCAPDGSERADVGISVVGPESIELEDRLWYDITITNTSESPASNIAFSANLPHYSAYFPSWSIVDAPDGNHCSLDNVSLRCSGITLPAQTREFTVRVQSGVIYDCGNHTIDVRMGSIRQSATTTTTGPRCSRDVANPLPGAEPTIPAVPPGEAPDEKPGAAGMATSPAEIPGAQPEPAMTVTSLPSTGAAVSTGATAAWWVAAMTAISLAGIGLGVRRQTT